MILVHCPYASLFSIFLYGKRLWEILKHFAFDCKVITKSQNNNDYQYKKKAKRYNYFLYATLLNPFSLLNLKWS